MTVRLPSPPPAAARFEPVAGPFPAGSRTIGNESVSGVLSGWIAAGHRPTLAQLADLVEAGSAGSSRASHVERAAQVGRTPAAVARGRRTLSALNVPQGFPRLEYQPGISFARPSVVRIVAPGAVSAASAPISRVRPPGSRPGCPQGTPGHITGRSQSHARVSTQAFSLGACSIVGDTPGGIRAMHGFGLRDVEPRSGSAEWTELRSVARELLREAKALNVLENADAYSSAAPVAAALFRLSRTLGGLDPAVRAVRRIVLRRVRLQSEVDRGAAAPRFPGRAVAFFLRPRQSVGSESWITGLIESWSAPGWPELPAPESVDGWIPHADDPAPFGPADPDRFELRRRAAGRANGPPTAAPDAPVDNDYRARLELASDPHSPGARGIRAVLAGDVGASTVLESFGPDWIGRIVSWRRAAERGSTIALDRLRALDRVSFAAADPADRRPMSTGCRSGEADRQARLRLFPTLETVIRYRRGARHVPVARPGASP